MAYYETLYTSRFNEFFIALGYKNEVIKSYFLDYYTLEGNITIDFSNDKIEMHDKKCEDWLINLIDTGPETNTGGRIKRLEPWLTDGTFMVTYGDGLCNVDLRELVRFHRSQGKIATVTAIRPPAKFGGIIFDGDLVDMFTEKPQIGEGWINGGFLVFEPEVFEYLERDHTSLEAYALERLAEDRQLVDYKHDGFWQCMDTLRDKRLLESLWREDRAYWKVWE